MSILIKDLPLAGYEISIMRDGDKWRARVDGIWCEVEEIKAPHGRLIDADKFKADRSMKNDCAECEKELQGSSRSCEYDRIYSKMDFCEWIDNAATVIEGEA